MEARRLLFLAALPTLFAVSSIAQSDPTAHNEGIVSRITRQPVTSSALAAVGYSKRLHALEVEFVNGAIYRYLDVPQSVYKDLMSAESKASFYDWNVRYRYKSIRVRQHRRAASP
jgi:hypothetical protein